MIKNILKIPHQNQQIHQKITFLFAKTKSGKRWMKEHVTDHYVKEAIKLGYRSRAAFKLIEIQQKYKILKPEHKVLDMGAAPGGWTEIAVKYVNKTQRNRRTQPKKDEKTDIEKARKNVLAIDRLDMEPVEGSFFYKGDLLEENTRLFIPEYFNMEQIDVCLSDMAPNFSGDLDIDHHNINILNSICLDISMQNLKPGGTLLMKTLQGAMEKQYFMKYKQYFKEFQRVKPGASRSRSSEIYYLGRGFKMSQSYFIGKKFEKKVEEGSSEVIPEEEMSLEDQVKFKKMTIEFLKKTIRKGNKLEKDQIKELKQMDFLSDFQDWDKLEQGKNVIKEGEQFLNKNDQEIYEEIQEDAKNLLGEGALSFTEKERDFFKEMEEYETQMKKVEEQEKEEEDALKTTGKKKEQDKDEELFLSDDELHPEEQRQTREQLYDRFEKFFGNTKLDHDYMVQEEEEKEADKRIEKKDMDSDIENFMNSGSLEELKDKALNFEQLLEMEKIKQAEQSGDPLSAAPMDEILEQGRKSGFTEDQVMAIFEEYEACKNVMERYNTHSLQEFMELREKKGDYKSNKDKKDRFEKLFGNEDFMKNVFTKK